MLANTFNLVKFCLWSTADDDVDCQISLALCPVEASSTTTLDELQLLNYSCEYRNATEPWTVEAAGRLENDRHRTALCQQIVRFQMFIS